MSGNIVHGHARRGNRGREWNIWRGMIARCYAPYATGYSRYGGRGITVCDRWRRSFLAFYADMGRCPSADHTIERKENNGNYEPGNCRWATRAEQVRNTRRNHLLTLNGETHCVKEWSEITGLSTEVIHGRIGRLKWSVEKALTTPVRAREPFYLVEFNGQKRTISEWAQIVGMKRGTLKARLLENAWSIEKALTTPCRSTSAAP